MINKEKWDALTAQQKAIIETSCGDNMREGLAEGEAIQGKALKTLKEKGVQIHKWSPEILSALNAAWLEVVEEDKAKSENCQRTQSNLLEYFYVDFCHLHFSYSWCLAQFCSVGHRQPRLQVSEPSERYYSQRSNYD